MRPHDDLLPLLDERLLGQYHPLLADTRASIRFVATDATDARDAGDTKNSEHAKHTEWTVTVERGRATAAAGGRGHPDTTVRATRDVLTDVIAGRRSGIGAFLDGQLTVRGNLALSLQLDGMFPAGADDDSRTFTRSVRAAGIDTFYLESGPPDAPPVVLVHGLSATNASMLPLIPALSRDYHVLAPDLPGHGGTEARPGAKAAPYLGDWLIDFLRNTCDEPAVLIGNSLGGRTSLEAGLLAPDLVRGLVLLCPAVAFRKLRQMVPFVRIVPDEIAALPVRIPRRVAMRGLRQLFADPDRISPAWLDAAMDEFIRVISIRANRRATFSALRHIYLDEPFGEKGFWDRLPGLKPPALFIWGDRDVLVPAGFARFVDEALPRAQTVILDDCGHVPQFEYPERTNELTREFLAGLKRPRVRR